QCHSPAIFEMPNKTLIVSFFAGSHEKAKDVGSWMIKRRWRSSEWTEPRLFLKVKKKSMGTAHFFVPPDKKEIWVFFNLMHGPGWSTCNQPILVYKNNLWIRGGYLRRMIGWCSRGKMHVLSNRCIIAPMHDELLGYKSYFLISCNGGKSWKASAPVKVPRGCLEPTIVLLNDSKILCFLRTKIGEIYESWSLDGGLTWTRPVGTSIPNPDSMVELLKLDDGTIVLAYNHSKHTRSPLCVRYSKDGARTWSEPKVIASGKGEFSYPWMILGSDRLIYLVYTNRRKTISLACFDQEWLES
ncbi:MAG: exo-alpha-sialidase, partial [Promethearchaeota archaeon]